jgi:hypothetical protein
MKNLLMPLLISLGELLLFIFAFMLPNVQISALLITGLAIVYYLAIRLHYMEAVPTTLSELIQKNFSLPAILLILYFIAGSQTLKLAIIAFAGQGALKMLYYYFSVFSGPRQIHGAQ